MPKMRPRKFPGKIILFGEYTVLEGYRALALPYFSYYGEWVIGKTKDQRLVTWIAYLSQLSEQKKWIEKACLAKFAKDIEEGWQFKSNIPLGYGAGSSGAFVAAWYYRYIDQSPELPIAQLQERLSALEAHFHGKSSGLDPLVSLLQSALQMQQGEVQKVPMTKLDFPSQLSLVDTGITRTTSPIVKVFQQKKQDKAFVEKVMPALGLAQELAIDAYLLTDWKTVGEQMAIISHLQYEHFAEMIPEALRHEWRSGWENGLYYKLCGAGGGGFMLKWNSNISG